MSIPSTVTAPSRWLLQAPRRGGHPVVAYPGFLASDSSTRPLRRILRALGHEVHGWGQGRNLGARAATLEHALAQVSTLHASSGRFTGPREANRATRTYQRLMRGRPAATIRHQELHAPPPCPTTSIFSRTDGIVAWPCRVQAPGAQAESIEVRASHVGMGVNPFVLYALADRLAQPEGAWQPFHRGGARRFAYPDPYRTTPEEIPA